jgi:hypothetical protein
VCPGITALISMPITTNAYLGQVSLLFLVFFRARLPGGCSRRPVLTSLIYSLVTFDNNYDNSLANYYLNNNNYYYSSFFYDYYHYIYYYYNTYYY